MANDADSNNGLYFIVGGLLVAAVVIAMLVISPNSEQTRMNATNPAAGEVSTSSTTNETSATYDADENSITRTEKTQTTKQE